MTKIDLIKPYLTELTLDEPCKFVEALGMCGAILGFWGFGGITGNQLRHFMSKSARAEAYIEFDVPKKSGGVRRISAPIEKLKQIQQALNLMLQAICEVSPAAMGFVPGRSIRTNAEAHIGSSVIFNCDLKDFFPSITKVMVWRTLWDELKPLNPAPEVINLIGTLVTAPRTDDGEEVLPQGAPTSPVISNLVLKTLDRRMIGFAKKNGYRYTRYADDITFSHPEAYNPKRPIQSDAILSIIEDCGLTVNTKKTVIQTLSGRREVTGLTVGEKVNVSRKYVKQLRTLLHLWEQRGFEEAQTIYTRDFCGDVYTDLGEVINGKINYICMIKGRNDSTYRRLKYRYRRLIR